jgi:predicted transcriptional regulator
MICKMASSDCIGATRQWLDSALIYCNTLAMEVQFTPEQEVRLGQIASVEGVAPARLVQDAALLLIEDDERFRAGVRKGIEQADQGIFIEEAEMDARIARMLSH